MVVAQLASGGVQIFYKLAINDGMNTRVLIAYRYIFATAFISSLAFILERWKSRPRLTWMIALQGFLCGLFGGALGQNLYVESMVLTSPTFSAAMANLIPAVTFIFAIFLGLEKLAIRTWAGKAKVTGTLLGIGGAMVLTFYRGPQINIWSTKVHLLKHKDQHVAASHRGMDNRVLGSLLAVASCFSYATWYIIQAKMGERYPFDYSSTALMCASASVQTVVYAMCKETNWSAWKLGWNIRLLTVAYTGYLSSGFMVVLTNWCVRKRGPLFVSVFNPLLLVFVAILDSLLLDEKLHLGSIIGGVLIVIGLYAMLWAKREEMKSKARLSHSKRSKEAEIINVGTAPAEDDDVSAAATANPRQ
ncbi:WAT1-related protein At1g68170-like isoform X1 [Vitis riparia]|uniref:WAT1-related protein At1g68170-like isoform X1 n=1 Tax=Vitis riparia TaxID=96939 RepID=UPI00155A5888|nr:WAT1-related protein At1g68170-like isoform X1 [Vitis riparia]